MANEHNLVPFGKGHDPRRNIRGRPKNVYKELNEFFSKDEIMTMFGVIGFFTRDEAQAIIDDPSAGLLEQTVAQAFLKSATKGDFRYISEIISHCIGKPKEQLEAKTLTKILVEYVNPNDTAISSPHSTETGTE